MITQLKATCIGCIGRQIIHQDQQARLWGITSRGAFILTHSNWVVFLSGEVYRGPLSLNVEYIPAAFQGMNPGEPVQIQGGDLYFPTIDWQVITGEAGGWSAGVLPSTCLSAEERSRRLEVVSSQVWAQPGVFAAEELDTQRLALRTADPAVIAAAIEPVLGRGGGLTPSGDDLVIGLLLALNRWREQFYQHLPVEQINTQLIQAARRCTTTLSANLIECAAQGQADERLALTLDGLVSGEPDAATCVGYLRRWGSSSGGDALHGMALALAIALA